MPRCWISQARQAFALSGNFLIDSESRLRAAIEGQTEGQSSKDGK